MLQRQRLCRGLVARLWLAAACLFSMGAAMAQNMVTGAITSNTTLRAAQSPYVFQGDVVLDNNATLSIEPGVTVRMAPAASFTVRKGALQAVGTPGSPIVVTSAAATPAAGDWRQWRFTPGTNSALTQLGYVTIEYGSGVAIESASPVINNTAINHHSGPAITMDLASSPIGGGNSAIGNSINAIAVPAGTIRSQVIWGVVGIPYLVQQGLVHVGQAPLALEPPRLRLSPGVVALLRVTLNAPAPAGGVLVDVTSSVPSVASSVSRVTVPQGQTSADLEVQANALGTTRVTASHAALGFAETEIEVVNLPAMGLAPSSPTVGVQRSYPMTLSLPEPAAANVAVQLGNADGAILSAPASLVVPTGQQSVNFEVTGLADGVSRLTAQAEGYASALATVTVRGKALVLPSSVIVAPGGQTTVTLEATEPAPASGLAVALALEQAGLAQVPASVQIPAGQNRATFVVQGQSLGTTNLTASAAGYQSTATVLRVDAIGLDTEPSADIVMNAALTRNVRVLLSKAAPQGGVTASVASRDAAIASVTPTEVFIPQGQVYATVPVAVKALAAGKTAVDIAAPGLVAKVVNVDVREKFALRFNHHGGGSKLIVGKGLYNYYYAFYVERLINGVVSNGADAVTVNLRCVAESVCKAPATVTIPAGQSYAYIQVTGVDAGTTQIEAAVMGATAAAPVPVPVEVIEPQVVFNSLDGQRTTASVRDNFSISLRVPGANYPDNQYAVSPLTVNLGLADQAPAGVVNGIYSAASGGNLITQLTITKDNNSVGMGYIAQPSMAGTYRLSAEVVGVTNAKSGVQTVTAAEQALRFNHHGGGSKLIVGKGLYNYYYAFYVERLINGVVSNGADAVTVNLRCVAESVCKAPATVTIPAGQSYAYIQVTGVDAGTTQIEAAVMGATAAAPVPVPVEVIEPQVVFNSLDGQRTTASVRDNFSISLRVPGANYPDNQYAVSPLTVNLGLADQAPAGVVNGIYSAASGGNLITQLTITKDNNSVGTGYIAQPSMAGTYRLSAEVVGMTNAKSGVQTVTAAEQGLKFTRTGGGSKLIVGKGLYSYGSELYVERLVNGVVSSGADAVTVNLRCVDEDVCKAPVTVTIPANQSSARVTVAGVDVGSTKVEATAEGVTAAAPMPVEVIEPQVVFNSLDGQRTTSSVRDNFSISLSVPGAYYSTNQYAASPLTVNLGLTDQSPAGVVNGIYSAASGGSLITQLTITKDNNSVGTGYIAQPSMAGTYRLNAEVVGVTNAKSGVQTVTAAEQGLKFTRTGGGSKLIVGKGLYSYYAELYVERLVNGVVSSGADAVTVNLRCVAESVCKTPATVTIPANQNRVSVTVTGVDMGSTQIEAAAAGFASAAINAETVSPILRLYNVPASINAGQRQGSIYVNAEVSGAYYSTNQYPASPLTVTWTSSVPSVGTITSTVVWGANAGNSGSATFTAVAPGTTRITASIPGFTPATSAPITVNP